MKPSPISARQCAHAGHGAPPALVEQLSLLRFQPWAEDAVADADALDLLWLPETDADTGQQGGAEGGRLDDFRTIDGRAQHVSLELHEEGIRGGPAVDARAAQRMGADDATTLRTETDLAFGAAVVPKGSYVLSATRVSEDKWQLNLVNAQDKKPVAKVPLELVKLEDSAEMMTIELKEDKGGAAFQLRWGASALRTSFAAK